MHLKMKAPGPLAGGDRGGSALGGSFKGDHSSPLEMGLIALRECGRRGGIGLPHVQRTAIAARHWQLVSVINKRCFCIASLAVQPSRWSTRSACVWQIFIRGR